MQVELRLNKRLKGLKKHGLYARTARDLNLNWRTIKDLCENNRQGISLEVLGRVCDWLEQNGLGGGLPGDLFGYRPSSLLQALAEPGVVTIYTGEYQSADDGAVDRSWVSRDDAAVGAIVVELLSKAGYEDGAAQHGVRYEHVYVPFQYKTNGGRADLDRDAAIARDHFEHMRSQCSEGTAILVGSQRSNYLLEHYVGTVWCGKPFVPGSCTPPFYLLYTVPRAPSCFGGRELPAGCDQDAGPGIYVRQVDGTWSAYPSNAAGHDAGIVILRRDPGEGRSEMAIFGYSGRATAAMGELLRDSPDDFWQPGDEGCVGPEVRVYLCRFELAQVACSRHRGRSVRIRRKTVELIDPQIEPVIAGA